MDLNEAAVFVRVVQAQSFSAAARQLELPVSTVSSRVARLEKRLGVTLLLRTTRRLQLTDAGRLFFEHASIGLAHLLEAEDAVSEVATAPSGRLRVTAPADIGDHILSAILCGMRNQYPDISVELVLVDRYVDLIAEAVDVAIRTGPLQDSTLIARNVGAVRWVAFASPAYLARSAALDSPQALRHHCCLQFTPLGRDQWTFRRSRASVTAPMPGRVMVNDIRLISAMVLAGEGVALLPTYLCRPACDEGKLVHVLPEWHARLDPIHIVYPQQRFVPHRVRVFVELAAQELRRALE